MVYGSANFSAASGGRTVAYAPDGKQIAAGGEDGTIRFFDARSGKIHNVLIAHEGTVLRIAYIPNSPILVSAGKELAVLLSGDFSRLRAILGRIK